MIISRRMATLRDIQEYYNYEDCLAMYDIILTESYNQRIQQIEDKRRNAVTK